MSCRANRGVRRATGLLLTVCCAVAPMGVANTQAAPAEPGVSVGVANEAGTDRPVLVVDPSVEMMYALEGEVLSWDASASYDPQGGDLTFDWQYITRGGTEIEGTGPTFELTYESGLTGVVVQVVATNESGVEAYWSVDIYDAFPPIAIITPSEIQVAAGEPVKLSGKDSYIWGPPPPEWPYFDFEWTDTANPGEVISTDPEYSRTFDTPGTYTVTLKVTSPHGESGTTTANVVVTPNRPAVTSIDPVRVLDTRPAHPEVPGPKGTVGAGKTVKFAVADVPTSATAVMLNVTSVAPGGDGHLTAYPCGERPNTANLNYYQGVTRGNSVLAKLSDTHEVCIWTLAAADIVVDVNGYVDAGSALMPLSPVRAYDSRRVGTKIPAGGVVEVPITTLNEVPDDADAVFVNLAVAAPSADGHLTAYPCGDLPPISSLNYRTGETLSSSSLVELTDNGVMCVRSYAQTDVVVDVLGYVQGAGFIDLVSDRKFDTRAKYTSVAPASKGAVAAGRSVKVELGVDPAGTAGVFLTVTAVAPQGDGHLTVYPCGDRPTTSGLNYRSGVTTSNMVLAKVDATGSVCVFTHATTDLVVDLVGTVVDNPAPTS